MKLALGPALMTLVAAMSLSAATGCAAGAPSTTVVPVSTTSLTSASFAPSTSPVAPSSLAPAAWEGDEPVPAAPTWGAPAQSVPIAPKP